MSLSCAVVIAAFAFLAPTQAPALPPPPAGTTSIAQIPHPLPTLPPKGTVAQKGECLGCRGADLVRYRPASQPQGGFDALRFTMSPQLDVVPNDYYYWAYETGFMNRQQFYFGLQPNGEFGKTALFSVFGTGTSSDAHYRYCKSGADGGSGTSCHIPYKWTLGHFYDFTVTLVGLSGTQEEWEGNVYDDVTGARTFIGKIVVPASAGYLDLNGGGAFDEYFAWGEHPCPNEPLSSILYLTPTGYLNGKATTTALSAIRANSGCNVKAYSDNASYVFLDNGT